MSLSLLANVCSHLQNATKARLSLTSITMTKQHLNLMLAMQKQGILSTVDVGGTTPPRHLIDHDPHIDHATLGFQTYNPATLAAKPWLVYPDPEFDHQRAQFPSRIPSEQADQRIWVGLKYWNNKSVLREMSLVSRAKKPIAVGYRELQHLNRGMYTAKVRPLTNPGECLFVKTSEGLFESRECVERKLGGQILCRIE